MRQHGTTKTEDANSQAGTARREQSSARQAVHPVLRLQQSIGNRAVQRMIRAQSNVMEQDEAEQESAPPLESTLNDALASPGHALDDESLAFMESSFGHDFSGVQLHTDSHAADSAEAINAKAYTVGQDIVFGAGQYSPQSAEGRRLIAHELTHVAQQQGTTAQAADLTISEPGDLSEHEAEHAAEQVMTGAAEVQTAANAGQQASVQRDDDDDEGWLGKIGGAISDAGSAVASGVGSAVDAGESLASSAGSAIASGVGSVVDTGEKMASSAGSAIASGVGSVVNAGENIASDVGSVAGKAWSGAKSVAGDVADFGGEVYGQMKKDAGYVQQGVSAVGSGVDWLENKAKAGTSWVADKASGIPVVSQIADAGKSLVDFNVDMLGGAAKGVTGLAGGILSAAADPVDTAKGLYTMSEHIPGLGLPQKLLGGAYDLAQGKSLSDVADETLNPMSDLKYWGNVGKGFIAPYQQAIAEGKSGEAVGRLGVDVGSLLIGAGEAGDAAKVAQLAEGADAAKVAEVADAAKVADVADASKAADAADASKAASVPPEPVQVPVDPNVNPTAPTQLPPGPTELPPHPPLSPDYLENPGIPKAPPVPTIPEAPPGGFPELPPSPASPAGALEGAPGAGAPGGPVATPGRGMDIKTLGTPTGEIGSLTDEEIENFVNGMEGDAKSGSMFEMPGTNPETGGGLQNIVEDIKSGPRPPGPNPQPPPFAINGVAQPARPWGIPYNVNHYLSDLANPRIAEAADVGIDAVRPQEGVSVVPGTTPTVGDPVPPTYMSDLADDSGVLNQGNNPIGNANAELRYHSTNAAHPAQGPTVQVNTPNSNFGGLGQRPNPAVPEGIAVEGQEGKYLLPDGSWKTIGEMTPQERALAHWPTGG